MRPGHFNLVLFIHILKLFIKSVVCQNQNVGYPDWKVAQAAYQPRNYNLTELDNFCRMTDVNRINTHLDNILIPRIVGSENHRKVSAYIKNFLTSLGYRVEFDHFTQDTVVGTQNFRNIIATLDPYAPRRLVLSCHYDSKDFRPSFEFYGATDSALPCALLLDIAQSLNTVISKRTTNDLTLQLIFFDGEEAFRSWSPSDSLYGSTHLASKWSEMLYPPNNGYGITELHRIDLLLLLDLLGAANPVIHNYAMFDDRNAYELLYNTEQRLSTVSGCLSSVPRIFRSSILYASTEDDHLPFLQKRVKIVHLIPIPFPSVWHQQTDNREALDTPTMENLSTILRVFTASYLGINI